MGWRARDEETHKASLGNVESRSYMDYEVGQRRSGEVSDVAQWHLALQGPMGNDNLQPMDYHEVNSKHGTINDVEGIAGMWLRVPSRGTEDNSDGTITVVRRHASACGSVCLAVERRIMTQPTASIGGEVRCISRAALRQFSQGTALEKEPPVERHWCSSSWIRSTVKVKCNAGEELRWAFPR